MDSDTHNNKRQTVRAKMRKQQKKNRRRKTKKKEPQKLEARQRQQVWKRSRECDVSVSAFCGAAVAAGVRIVGSVVE